MQISETTTMQVLVIEDDKQLRSILVDYLEKESYICNVADSLDVARSKLTDVDTYDMIILDRVLPDGDGADFCHELRSRDIQTPILMLTGKGSTADRVSGLDSGADDYMAKPFSPQELSARMRALLRRPEQTLAEELQCGDITLNVLSHSVKKGGKTVALMPKEYSLLEYLMRKKNQAVRKEELLRHVWGVYSRTSSNRLEVYIRYLREKIDLPFDSQLIQTVRGMGYKIADE